MVVSPDSKTLYMGGSGLVYAYNIATGALTGWSPAPVVEPLAGGLQVGSAGGPNLAVFDDTGLLAGPMEEGLGFVDTSVLRTGAVGTGFSNGYLTPATGPASSGTTAQWQAYSTGSSSIQSVLFGSNPATDVSNTSTSVTATTPAGTPGPVDVDSFASDGGVQIISEGFSYGPTILDGDA